MEDLTVAEEAVIREVFEETGVRMEVDRLGFVHENFFVGDAKTNLGKKIYEISFYFYMKVPRDFEPICNSFTEDEQKEHLVWIDRNTDQKYYPEFFREEGAINQYVTHMKMIKDDCVNAVLARIIKDEEYHIMVLRALMEEV